jgi:hypothetical protein
MNSTQQNNHHQSSAPGVNPFARALAEARGAQGSGSDFSQLNSNVNRSPQLGNGFLNESSSMNEAEQQRIQAEKMRHERLRAQLHRQVNPVEATDVFNAREAQVKKQIDEIRYELKLLNKEVEAFSKDIEMTVMANVAAPGQTGTYYFNFFQKLREFIILLRKKIHSARTWATTMNSKKKKKGKNAPGLEIGGQQHEQTTTVFDRMHHERSTVYSGS